MGSTRDDADALGPIERQDEVAERAIREGFVSAKHLASLYGVSVMTIYRDLDELQRQGVVRRERGGATAQPSSLFESNVRYRLRQAPEEKEALCRRALGEVERGQAVMLDDSTTILPLARRLSSAGPITVMTNFGMALKGFSPAKEVRLICLGGEYLARHDAYAGVVCEAAIASLRADVLFLSTSAVSGGAALHQEQEIVRVKRAMLSAARRKILLVDHSKLGKDALHLLAPLSEFDLVLVDSGASESALAELGENGASYEVVPVAGVYPSY